MMHIHILLIPITPCEHPPRSIICDVFFCSHFLAVSTLFWLLLLGMHCIFKQLHPHQNTHSPHHRSDGKPLEVFQGETTEAPGGPANHWVTEDIAHLGPRKCWHKSNGSVNIHNSESHVVANFEEKGNQ